MISAGGFIHLGNAIPESVIAQHRPKKDERILNDIIISKYIKKPELFKVTRKMFLAHLFLHRNRISIAAFCHEMV